MSIYENSDVQQLVEIRESLFNLLERKLNGAFSTSGSAQLNEAIRSRTRDLRANVLCARPGYGLRKDLEALDASVSRLGHLLESDDKGSMNEILTRLRFRFDVWFERIEQEAAEATQGGFQAELTGLS